MVRSLQIRGILTVLFVAAAAVLWPVPFAGATATAKSGVAKVVGPNGAVLNAGGSGTVFTLQLPVGAACPGDSYHHGYLVYSYALPVGTDPGTLTFPGEFPRIGLNLITTGGVPFVTQPTAEFTAAIQTLPDFSWSRFDHDAADLPPGTYDVGLACARGEGRVESFWNVKIDFVASAGDPGGFTWHVAGAPADPAPGHSSHTGLIVVAALVVVALAATGLFLGRRRRQRRLSGPAGT